MTILFNRRHEGMKRNRKDIFIMLKNQKRKSNLYVSKEILADKNKNVVILIHSKFFAFSW